MVDLTKDTFNAAVAASVSKPLFVDFWGTTCSHCFALLPSVETLAQKYAGRIDCAKVNAQENRRVAVQCRVMGLPAFLFFKDGREVSKLRLHGLSVTAEQIENNIEEILHL